MIDSPKKILNTSGTAILLAVLVMSTILTAALATSKLVINEVMQSTQIDYSTIAFYAAESGLEKSLFNIRQKDAGVQDINTTTEVFDNQASYIMAAQDTEEILYTSLKPGETYQIDLFNPNSLDVLENPIKSVSIDWDGIGDSCLEMKWISWNTNGQLGEPQNYYACQDGSPDIIQLFQNDAYLYRLRLLARYAASGTITIKAYSDVDPGINCQPLESCQVPLPARVSLAATGRFPETSLTPAEQNIVVTMPVKSPLAGLYDYVLYSENDIVKEN